MNHVKLILALAGCLGLSACSFLKPAKVATRHFVLTSAAAERPSAAPGGPAIGLGQVKLPAYLFPTGVAVRRGANEIDYLPAAVWAERLDTGFQRVLAADLSRQLPTDRVFLSAWERDEVSAEVYVVLERFEVDIAGHGLLAARWRIAAPGGDKIIRAGVSRFERQGPAPGEDIAGSIGTLSGLVAEFAAELTKSLEEAPPTNK